MAAMQELIGLVLSIAAFAFLLYVIFLMGVLFMYFKKFPYLLQLWV